MSETIIELICIGREVLDGRVIDTNSVEIAKLLRAKGIVPRFATRVDDVPEQIMEVFQVAEHRANVIIVTGGLGPTEDDKTLEVFAKYAGLSVAMHPEAQAMVEEAFAARGIDFKSMQPQLRGVQLKQALLPVGAVPIKNIKGTAPGVFFNKSGCSFYFLPGVPVEMKTIFANYILPTIPGRQGYRSYEWFTHFTSEGELQNRLQGILQKIKDTGLEISFRTKAPENHIGLYGTGAVFDSIQEEISELLRPDCFSHGIFGEVKSLETLVVEKAVQENLALCTVESCTGGKVADRIVSVPGASKAFWGTFVTYDNLAKESLGVPQSLLQKHGAVSEEVAMEMAKCGLKRVLHSGRSAAACVSITGVAGPEGGTEAKPVGLCFVGYADSTGLMKALRFSVRPGLERATYQAYFAQKALAEFFTTLHGKHSQSPVQKKQ